MKISTRFRNVLEQLRQHKDVLMNVGERNFNYMKFRQAFGVMNIVSRFSYSIILKTPKFYNVDTTQI